jgi:hypothetical protein
MRNIEDLLQQPPPGYTDDLEVFYNFQAPTEAEALKNLIPPRPSRLQRELTRTRARTTRALLLAVTVMGLCGILLALSNLGLFQW